MSLKVAQSVALPASVQCWVAGVNKERLQHWGFGEADQRLARFAGTQDQITLTTSSSSSPSSFITPHIMKQCLDIFALNYDGIEKDY